MTTRTSATRYARALLDVSLEESTADHAAQDLEQISGLLQEFPELRRAFQNPAIPAARKRSLVQALLPTLSLSAPVGKLLLMLAERDRLSSFEARKSAHLRMTVKVSVSPPARG